MPKIRLSALATDIKGKSGGSVFSTNSGGTYFRNNPSGGGRKSASWDKAKSMFGSLAGEWRKLTDQQQEAWNTAAPTWPTNNAFGEPRLPSGYELFMRLNAPLFGICKPFMLTPPTQQGFHNFGEKTWNTIDKFLFLPQTGFSIEPVPPGDECETFNDCGPNEDCYLGYCFDPFPYPIVSDFPNAGPMTTFGISFLIVPQRNFLDPNNQNLVIPVLDPKDNTTAGLGILLSVRDGVINAIEVTRNGDNETLEITFLPSNLKLGDELRLSFSIDLAVPDNSRLLISKAIINPPKVSGDYPPLPSVVLEKTELAPMPSFSTPPTFTTPITSLFFLRDDVVKQNSSMIQDIRIYLGEDGFSGVNDFSDGYFSGLESVVIDTKIDFKIPGQTAKKGDSFKLEVVGIRSNEVAAVANIPQDALRPNKLYTWVVQPVLNIETEFQGVPDVVLVVEATPPISGGRTGAYNNFKRIAVVETDGLQSWDVGANYMSIYGTIPFGSIMRFRVSTINKASGEKDKDEKVKEKPKQSRPRFKAGAEMSSSVN
jgi:hypothetical protein